MAVSHCSVESVRFELLDLCLAQGGDVLSLRDSDSIGDSEERKASKHVGQHFKRRIKTAADRENTESRRDHLPLNLRKLRPEQKNVDCKATFSTELIFFEA